MQPALQKNIRNSYALKKAGKSVEWLVIRRSGHGAWEFKKRQEMYSKLLKFLGKHLDA